MDDQPTLFDEVFPSHPAARGTDPTTSHLAGASAQLRAGTAKARLLDVYARSEHWNDGLCDEDAATDAQLPIRSCWWKRCSELRADGYIEPTGRYTTSQAGEQVMLCRITHKGIKAHVQVRHGR